MQVEHHTYGVDSYHVNIGTGDASLHVLVDITFGNYGQPTSRIWRDAVLVDTGYHAGNANGTSDNLLQLLRFRSHLYDNQQGDCKISHIVLTHWDEDHYSGVISLFESFIKLDHPNGVMSRMDTYKPSFLRPDQENFLIGPNVSTSELRGIRFGGGNNIAYTIDPINAGVTHTQSGPIPPDKVMVFEANNSEFPRFRPGVSMIGQNLFNLKTDGQVPDYKTITSPEDLLAKNPPVNGVGMYIVAANLGVIGHGLALNAANNKNNDSIAIMIIYQRNNGAAYISHYFAGDLGLLVEAHLVAWTHQHHVQTMKLSHHGATDSTPSTMLSTWRPRNIIVSAGEVENYGHPRWEIMLLLHEYMKWLQAQNDILPLPLYVTQYPYYLLKHTFLGAMVYSNLEYMNAFTMFRGATAKAASFQAELAWFSQNQPALQGVYADYQAATQGADFPMQRQWILQRTEQAFRALSDTSANATVWWVRAESRDPDIYPRPSQVSVSTDDELHIYRAHFGQNQVLNVPNQNVHFNMAAQVLSHASMRMTKQIARPLALDADMNNRTMHGRSKFSQFPTYSQELRKPGTTRANIITNLGAIGPLDLAYFPTGYDMDEMDSQDRLCSPPDTVPQTTLPVLQDPLPPSGGAETSYYLYSSDVRPLDGASNVEAMSSDRQPTEKILNEFVMALHRGVLGLEQKPVANSTLLVDENDEWFSWLKLCFNAEGLSMTLDDKGFCSGFILSLPFSQSYKSKDLGVPNAGDPGLLPPTTVSLGSLGIVADRNFMVFSLDETKVTDEPELNLTKVLNRSGVGSDLHVLQSTAMAFVGALPLKLDTRPDSRNMLTFFPEINYLTVLRNQYLCTATAFNDFLKWMDVDEKYFSITEIIVITKKQCTWRPAPSGTGVTSQSEFIMGLTCQLNPSGVGKGYTVTTAMKFTNADLELAISLPDGLPIAELLTWVVKALGLTGVSLGDILKGAQNLQLPQPRRVCIRFAINNDGTIAGIHHVSIDLTVAFQTSNKPVLTLFTYQWDKGTGSTFTGSLWCRVPPSRFEVFLPDYEPLLQLQAPKPEEQSTYLDLKELLGSDLIQNIPEGLPTKIIRATIRITEESMALGGTIVSDKNPSKDVPMPRLQLCSLDLDLFWGWTKKRVGVQVRVRVALLPPTNSTDDPAELGGFFQYSSEYGSPTPGPRDKRWRMVGSVSDLKMSNLYSLFDSTSQDAAMDVMQAITIQSLTLQYDYSGNVGSQFTVTADVVLGGFLFGLTYQYKTGGIWHVQANLSAAEQSADQSTTIGGLVKDVIGSNDEDLAIPGFLAEVEIKKPNLSTGLLGLYCSKTPNTATQGSPSNEGICFVVYGVIESLVFTFTQFKSTPTAHDAAAGNKGTGSMKRIIKASVVGLPKLDIPLLGDLTQPFDEMYFLWVQDASKDAQGAKGVTAAEVAQINSQYTQINSSNPTTTAEIPQLLFKAPKTADGKVDPAAVVIEAGWHFVLVLKDEQGEPKIVIDYVFGKSAVAKSKEPNKGTKAVSTTGLSTDKASGNEQMPSPDGPAQLAPMKKKQGPLSFDKIGFEYKDDVLSLLLDAKIAIGPLEFSLIGLKISMNLRDVEDTGKPNPKKVTLQTLGWKNFSLSLAGIAVSFDKPPMRVAGKFVHAQYEDIEYYAGGIIIGFDPWLFQAAGMYGFKEVDGHKIKNVFVFLKLDGPLITIGYADISGLTGGLGYNMDLKWPSVSEITRFPFVASGSDGSDPMTQLDALTTPGGWITPKDDVMWCAVGMKVAAFKVILAIFALAVIDVPSTTAKKKFAHVELGISASVDPGAGVMKLEAQLSPNSFILDPSCHLTGGFALYTWWTPLNPQIEASPDNHAGDWVLTIGGYHRNYVVPPHYPLPDRLQISWSLGNTLSITGQAYFAITPKCCMGGARLQATLSVGLLLAWFDAYVDFLVNYEPFRFIGDGGLTIGVKFTLDLWLVTIHINVEISANLHIEGPPVHGYVHVDFYVFGFDIEFGSPEDDQRIDIPLKDFYDAVLQSTNGAKQQSQTPPPPSGNGKVLNEAHTFSCLTGMIPPLGKDAPDAAAPWLVKPGNLAFAVSCKFAVNTVTVLGEDEPLTGVDGLYAKPMRRQSVLSSVVDVDVFAEDEDPKANKPSKHASPADKSQRWIRSTKTQRLPNALYGYYDPSTDPLSKESKGNNITDLLKADGATCTLTTDIQVEPPPSQPSADLVAKFNSVDEFKQLIYSSSDKTNDSHTHDEKNFPGCPATNTAWDPATPDPDPVTQYKATANAWRSVDQKAGEECIAALVDALGWLKVNPGLTNMSAAVPEVLLDHFDDLYIAAPTFCQDHDHQSVNIVAPVA